MATANPLWPVHLAPEHELWESEPHGTGSIRRLLYDLLHLGRKMTWAQKHDLKDFDSCHTTIELSDMLKVRALE